MATNRPSTLGVLDDHLPPELRELIYSYCPTRTLTLFARSSYSATEDARDILFSRLMQCAVNAEPVSYSQADETKLMAIAILKRYPELLFRKKTITDHYGRKIKASPFRIFWGAGDTWALKQVYEDIIPHITGGEAKAEIEFKKQFPDCPWPPTGDMPEENLYDDRNREQIARVIAQLKIIIAKITVDPCTNAQATLDETTKSIEDLCKILKPKQGEVIQTGLYCPLGIMREIIKVYDTQLHIWNGAQNVFFSRVVLGTAEAALTAVDGQCVKNGLEILDGELYKEKVPDRRNGLFCREQRGIPKELVPLMDKLGRTLYVDPYAGGSVFLSIKAGYFDWYYKNGHVSNYDVGAMWAPWEGFGEYLANYIEQKQRHMKAIMQPLEEKPTHHDPQRRCVCVIL